jgi:hypothetical protein
VTIANINVLDDFLWRAVRARDSGLERIKIAHHHVDGLDAVFPQGGLMFGVVADGKDAAVNVRVQRLDPSIEHFRKSRYLGDLLDLKARIG